MLDGENLCAGCTPDNCAGCKVVSLAAAEIANIAADSPINMVLHCPSCHTQHIDAPDHPYYGGMSDAAGFHPRWDNPPHRSHLCHQCGTIWRPADVCTNGVARATTRGKNDTWAP